MHCSSASATILGSAKIAPCARGESDGGIPGRRCGGHGGGPEVSRRGRGVGPRRPRSRRRPGHDRGHGCGHSAPSQPPADPGARRAGEPPPPCRLAVKRTGAGPSGTPEIAMARRSERGRARTSGIRQPEHLMFERSVAGRADAGLLPPRTRSLRPARSERLAVDLRDGVPDRRSPRRERRRRAVEQRGDEGG